LGSAFLPSCHLLPSETRVPLANMGGEMKTPHTHFKRGTPLRVILRGGQHVYDQYEDHGSGYMILRKRGRLQLRSVKSVTIWKGGVSESGNGSISNGSGVAVDRTQKGGDLVTAR
jgi:hypothetical protein